MSARRLDGARPGAEAAAAPAPERALRRIAWPLVGLVAAVPRLVVLLHERGTILSGNVEKSNLFALTFIHSGTYGFIPGQPSAYTQPLYGWFLVAVYWIFGRNWLAVGLSQIVLAAAVAILVYEIARRLASTRWAAAAAVVATLHPYLVWHDVHVNREIVDQLCAASLVLLTLAVADRPTLWRAGALGLVTGLAMLGNSRLVFIPILCAVYLAFRVPRPALVCAFVLAGAAVAVAPWLVRNKVNVGCWTITTDGRALWKANNPQAYPLLSSHQWIDNVSPDSPRPPEPGHLTPDEAHGIYVRTQGQKVLHPDECLAMSFYEHLAWTWVREHPQEKAKLAGLSEQLFWQPNVIETGGSSSGFGKQVAEPAYMIALYALAAVGVVLAPRAFVVFALLLFAYQSAFAAIFVGATRYRISFDFLLAVLAAAGVARLVPRLRR
ncbi:MAG TPA: glycosyltransferase family 39 protein [Gaiellaceae bacterium]|nr:glycosyltransferase family 39 protein [Gaiellaceae bacterium]